MMKNKKLIYLGIGIGLLVIVVITVLYFTHFSCSGGHYTVTCYYQESEEVKKIPCTSNKDCSSEIMTSYCSPGAPNLLKCAGVKYYCGEDGYCKGCDCPLW